MLYRFGSKSFRHHVHPALQRNIRIFIVMSACMMLIACVDLVDGDLDPVMAIAGVAVGTLIGFASSRIFHLSWNHDGRQVVSRIDTIGGAILALYVLFEITRASIFQIVFDTGAGASVSVTFIFVGAAMIARVLGMRGKIINILKKEEVFE